MQVEAQERAQTTEFLHPSRAALKVLPYTTLDFLRPRILHLYRIPKEQK